MSLRETDVKELASQDHQVFPTPSQIKQKKHAKILRTSKTFAINFTKHRLGEENKKKGIRKQPSVILELKRRED
ncbi:hypothetical protein CEXT_39931 [Caerostris extrusa]|uniref:Uncharacterized protein n=1 Tax=Caerostris extrusa TaxID=172846 RepID=A0AAV4SNM6_CAEEX|nr:hypothetical protein CEXT_39931 [Caerostris extrusa]